MLLKLTLPLLCLTQVTVGQLCNIYCDGKNPEDAVNTRTPVTAEIFGRIISLHVADDENMVFAEISNGDLSDSVWLDRSMDGGVSWSPPKLGEATIPGGSRSARTLMFNVDNPADRQLGALRACGKAGDRDELACTGWARSTVKAGTPVEAGATALMQFYDRKLWPTTGWWNSANCLTAIIDYMKVTGNRDYMYAIDEVFEKNKGEHDGDFTNEYIDDTLWWGLAWVGAFDLTGDMKYLDMAKIDSDYSYMYKDDVCGGGLWWTTRRDYKNAIPNELFIKLAAALHRRIPGDTKYLGQAIEVLDWFKASGMINSNNLINDGLTSDCQNNGQVTWSYNQGVIIGGLVELAIGTGDPNGEYISLARAIADAVERSPDLNPGGVLFEYGCEGGGGDCGGDGPSFKGIYTRNLGELDRHLPGRPYKSWLEAQANSVWNNNKNSLNQFGVHWAGPFNTAHAANQHSAFEALVAAV